MLIADLIAHDADLTRAIRRAQALAEGKVYQIDWGYAQPVRVFSNPSLTQLRTMIAALQERHGKRQVVFRGLLLEGRTVLIWDAFDMTHDDVLSELFPDMSLESADVSTFEAGAGGRFLNGAADYDPADNAIVKRLRALLDQID